ncbi:hypothetical protein [Mucilaginibacter sp. CSA2-8R]|uniref:hypothetical protein n=1 Tax=Mucilaginibacter sp. CSA2-8R TaxID=3141542 RepID=UPI00315C5681
MILSKADLQQIKAFISKRGFTEPDLQMEIVDHVACRVEDLMNAEQDLNLQKAITLTHESFGVMGFSVFEDSMRSALQKRYWQVFKSYFKSAFSYKMVPVMLASIYLSGLIFTFIQEPEYVFGVTGALLLLAMVCNGIFNEQKFKPYNKMLTFKMGNIYLVICSVLFQVYNLLIVQLKLYRYLSPAFTGTLFAVILIIILAAFFSVTKTQLKAVNTCKQLQEKYALAE